MTIQQEKAKNYYSKFINSNDNPNLEKFFTDHNIDDYYDKLPYLPEIEVFCVRLFKALLNNEKVCIYADFDTDAVTATGVMFHGLIDQGFDEKNIQFYTPDRFKEGYGINLAAIKLLSAKYDLIITVDCGINSCIEANYILDTAKNCDLIITDHHLSAGTRPQALSVCNPQMKNYCIQNDYLETLKTNFSVTMLKLDKSQLTDEQNANLIKFNQKFLERISNIANNSFDNFLSKSTTGVGVSWFCLVFFAYFLEEIGF